MSLNLESEAKKLSDLTYIYRALKGQEWVFEDLEKGAKFFRALPLEVIGNSEFNGKLEVNPLIVYPQEVNESKVIISPEGDGYIILKGLEKLENCEVFNFPEFTYILDKSCTPRNFHQYVIFPKQWGQYSAFNHKDVLIGKGESIAWD